MVPHLSGKKDRADRGPLPIGPVPFLRGRKPGLRFRGGPAGSTIHHAV